MAGTEKAWADAKAQAQKIIGKEGKLPKPRVDPMTAMDDANKLLHELFKARDTLEGKLIAAQAACAKVTLAAKQYGDMVDGADFDLDAKKPDDKKKIADAQKVLEDQLGTIEKFADKVTDILGTLDKSLASIEKDIRAAS